MKILKILCTVNTLVKYVWNVEKCSWTQAQREEKCESGEATFLLVFSVAYY